LLACRDYDEFSDETPTTTSDTYIHPDAEFCEIWENFWEHCLEEDVVADPAEGTTAEQMIIDWALYMSNDPSSFMSDIGNTLMCPQIPADECSSAISDFESNYGIELTEEEETDIRTAIEGICGDQEAVNNEALGLYLDLDEDHFEELDPDLTIDCASFHFEEINDHNIIVAGVANVHVDFYYRASNRSGYFTMFSEIWFEVPRLRSNGSIVPIGEAKRMCAQAVVDAEEEIEDIFKNVQPFQGAVRAKFIEILSANVRQWGVAGGGRATLQNNHGVDLQPAVYVSIGPGWCN
jgi:hypothetical protein